MTLPRDLGATHAWRGAFVAATLNAVAMPGDFLLARDIPNMPWYPSAVSALVGVGLLVVLLIRRQRATVRLGSVVFLVNTVAILVALWITSGYWAAADKSWTPFQANKLGALAVALLAPKLGVGLASIAGFAATAVGKFYVLDPGIQRRFPVGEPWVILFYALFGSVLLAYRLRGVTLERETLRLQAEAAAAEQLARTFLRLRDYANTPIQTIAFTVELHTGTPSRAEARPRPPRTRGGEADGAQPRSHPLRVRAQMEPGRQITGCGDTDRTATRQ